MKQAHDMPKSSRNYFSYHDHAHSPSVSGK